MSAPTPSVRGYRFGPFELDLHSGELHKRGLRVRLRGRPVEILRLLIERRGDLVDRDTLRARLWAPDTFVDFDHGLNSAMNKLRDALGDPATQARYVETVPKRGYRFVAPVEAVIDPPAADGPAGIAAPTAAAASAVVRAAPATAAPVAHRRRWTLVAALVVVLAAAGTLVAGLAWWPVSAKRPDARRMLVVLPFDNLGGDPTQRFFADGISDELIAQLGMLDPGRLGVIARTTALQYRGSAKNVMTIGRELSVDYALEGSLRRIGGRVRIHARLLDVGSQTQLWAETYERDDDDVLMLQRDVAGRVAQSLAGGVLSPVLARETPGSPDFAAYELVLQARAQRQQATEAGAWQCVRTFEQAVRADPDYAPAHAGLADCYRLLGAPGWEAGPPIELMARARAAIDRALAIDPRSAEALAVRGMVRFASEWDQQGALADLDAAIAINPSFARALQYRSAVLTTLGRFDAAVVSAARAAQLDPLAPAEQATLGIRYYYAGRLQDAAAQLRTVTARWPHFSPAFWALGETWRELGRHDTAVDTLRQAVEISGHSAYQRAWLAHALAQSGRTGEAQAIRRDIERLRTERYVTPFVFALMAAGDGNRPETLAWIEKTRAARSGWIPFLRVEPAFRWLRTDPEFGRLTAVGGT
jgi:TolB-like protein/DNA-binding winged helix-turn-helix (wHTH) protein/tetratricopeptide (TPR) repeat protein